MKNMIYKITLIAMFFAANAYSQNTFFIGSKTYSCSADIEIKGREEFDLFSCWTQLTVTVVKDGTKGMMAFSNGSYKISGKILLYLDDNSIITLVDRGTFDRVNSVYTSIYYLTASEVNKLKITNISSIRYGYYASGQYEAKLIANSECISKIFVEGKWTYYI